MDPDEGEMYIACSHLPTAVYMYTVYVLTLAFDTGDDGVPRGPRGEGCILPQHKSNNNIIF